MIASSLVRPESIVVVGGSNDLSKPGGKVLDNILRGQFRGKLYVINPKETIVQNVPSYARVDDLPPVDLAILAIPARWVADSIRELIAKETSAFIVLSAGFGEESAEGRRMEQELAAMVSKAGASLIGPNCIGVLTPYYQGVFTSPVPKLDPRGCDFVSGSGSTACFIMEIGIPMGLTFGSVFSVGNSAQVGIEEILEHWDSTHDAFSSTVKLIYAEKISKPMKFLEHAASLVHKGCYLAAIKAGTSEAGMRAASSHTGALASSDVAVDALFDRAGVIRCRSKEELVNVAAVLMHRPVRGKRFAVATNAGGPGVLATDALTRNGLTVPVIPDRGLITKLHPGSSASNPIDFLATGTAAQFDQVLQHLDVEVDEVDAIIAIFGTPGMTETFDAHRVLIRRMESSAKPILAVLPSPGTASAEIAWFLEEGGMFFRDEVALADAIGRVLRRSIPPLQNDISTQGIDVEKARGALRRSGYLEPEDVGTMLDACGIERVAEIVAHSVDEAMETACQIGFPVVLKVIGPLHKSDVGGVCIGVKDREEVARNVRRMMHIPGATGILVQRMVKGIELFAGAKFEPGYGHLILCGLGGVLVEALKDIQVALSPLSQDEAVRMIRKLRSAEMFRPFRNQRFVNEEKFADILRRLSALSTAVPEIQELDLNPLLADGDHMVVVDARIRVSTENQLKAD